MNITFHSLFLARAMGLYFVIAAMVMLYRATYYRKLITNMKISNEAILVAGSIGLILGISLVLVHNIWMLNYEGLITLISWAILIKSICWLAIPERMASYSKHFYAGKRAYYAAVMVTAVIGIILLVHGFYIVHEAYV